MTSNATSQACHEFTSEEPDDLAGNLLACSAGCEQFLPSTINKPSFGFGRDQSFSPFRTAHGLAVGMGLHATDKVVTRSLSRGALRRIQELAVCTRALLRAAAGDDWCLCGKKDVEASEPRGEWRDSPGRPSQEANRIVRDGTRNAVPIPSASK